MFLFYTNPILIAAAVLPAIFLLVHVYRADKLEKEPAPLLISLVLYGIAATFIALVLERAGSFLLGLWFEEGSVAYNAIMYFGIVAFSEEGAKYFLLRRRTWHSAAFNCQFDGVVYAVFVALGFALWENISYVLMYGLSTALVRAVTAVPGHACFGVFMGVWYGLAKRLHGQGRDSASKLCRVLALLLPALLHGRRVMQLDDIFHFGYLVCAVENEGHVVIPDGSTMLHEGNDITILASSREAHHIFESIGMYQNSVKSCMIIGGGKSSYYLAKQLIEQKMEVKIIESNKERCDVLSTLLPEALVICGDGGDEELLKEEGIDSAEAFVPLTGLDEENILLTLFAKRVPGLKTITKINRITFNDVIDGLELGSVIYPKYITSEAIIAYVRARQNSIGSNVETLYHIFDNRVEAIEFRIGADAPVIGVPIMNLKLKDSLLIACINRGGKIIFPRGQDTIEPDDTVIIVTTHSGFGDISDILR